MRITRTTFLIAAAFAMAFEPQAIRAQGIAGVWATEVPTSVRNENGVEVVEATRTAHITITIRDDSARAVWRFTPSAEVPHPEARTLTGTFRDGRLVLTDTARAYMRTSGMGGQREIRLIQTYDLRLDGDTLRGQVWGRSEDGAMTTPRRDFVATRA